MKPIDFAHKKIGIWGFGIVGQSILQFLKQYPCTISIMDKKNRAENVNQTIAWTVQTPENIQQFLSDHDIIIPSPGIALHDYQKFAHKFVHELGIFTPKFQGYCIAITGTFGKTSVTSFLSQCIPNAQAAGNIGNAMLNALHEKLVILELSSYQLQYADSFAPNLAIWTNFHPNHLDHHRNVDEYFAAKCNILKHQNNNQIALLPAELWSKIKQTINVKSSIFLFSLQPIETTLPLFTVQNNQIVLKQNDKVVILFENITLLPKITFLQNWIIIFAALHLSKFQPKNITQIKPEPHRLELLKTVNGLTIFNDSKSTIWQTTKHAIDQFPNKRIALFLGGLSKGLDRSPLIQNLQNKSVTVFNFGKEAADLAKMCEKYHIAHYQAPTLEIALDQFKNVQNQFDILLFSPAGSSFDLFKDFIDRGNQFKMMIEKEF